MKEAKVGHPGKNSKRNLGSILKTAYAILKQVTIKEFTPTGNLQDIKNGKHL